MSFVPTQTPPSSFFNINGIYANRYDPSVISTFNSISTIHGQNGTSDPFANPRNDPLNKQFSYFQLQEYRRQIAVFQRVYDFNACQSTMQTIAQPARQFHFTTYKDLYDYREALAFIDKMYNVKPGYTVENMFIYNFPPFGTYPNPTQ